MSSHYYVLLLVKANLDFNKYHHHSTFYYYHWLYCFLAYRTDSIFKKVHLKLTISIQNHSSPFSLSGHSLSSPRITAPLSFQIVKETSNTPDLSKKCRCKDFSRSVQTLQHGYVILCPSHSFCMPAHKNKKPYTISNSSKVMVAESRRISKSKFIAYRELGRLALSFREIIGCVV